MSVSVFSVAARIRDRLPGIGAKKLHKLLYYAQGHHLATFGHPLFKEHLHAWDMGPVVKTLWTAEQHAPQRGAHLAKDALGEAELNTIEYAVSRYGRLTGGELERLAHSETPWQEADAKRHGGSGDYISSQSILAYFASSEDEEDPARDVDPSQLSAFLDRAVSRRTEPATADSMDELRARLG